MAINDSYIYKRFRTKNQIFCIEKEDRLEIHSVVYKNKKYDLRIGFDWLSDRTSFLLYHLDKLDPEGPSDSFSGNTCEYRWILISKEKKYFNIIKDLLYKKKPE